MLVLVNWASVRKRLQSSFSSAVSLTFLLEINGQHSLKDRVNGVPFSVDSKHETLGSSELTELTAASLLSLLFSPADPRWSSNGFYLKRLAINSQTRKKLFFCLHSKIILQNRRSFQSKKSQQCVSFNTSWQKKKIFTLQMHVQKWISCICCR